MKRVATEIASLPSKRHKQPTPAETQADHAVWKAKLREWRANHEWACFVDGSCLGNGRIEREDEGKRYYGAGGSACYLVNLRRGCAESYAYRITNNLAELAAVQLGLRVMAELVQDVPPPKPRTWHVLTDSSYALEMLRRDVPRNAAKNVELVQAVRALIEELELREHVSIVLHQVKAHTGLPYNERVDKMAKAAAQRGVLEWQHREAEAQEQTKKQRESARE